MDKRSNADNRNLCCFSYSDGRRCRMLRHPDHPGLCPFHSREERQALESERIGTELAASLTGHFLTASDINHVLGKVFTALAQDRISIKKAKALAYLAQLMLHSIPTVKDETKFKYTYETWSTMIDNAKKLPKPLPRTANAFAETVLGAAKAHPATGSTASEPRERHSPNGQHSAAPVSPNVGAGFSPSPTAAGSAPLGGGASAPTSQRTKRDTHLSSAHPSAASADACADSWPVKPNDNASHEGLNEDNT